MINLSKKFKLDIFNLKKDISKFVIFRIKTIGQGHISYFYFEMDFYLW